MLQKILIILQNAANESCTELNFLQITQAPKICVFNILQCTEIGTFTLGLIAANKIYYIENCFEQKLRRIKFSTKNSVKAFISSRVRAKGRQKFAIFEVL